MMMLLINANEGQMLQKQNISRLTLGFNIKQHVENNENIRG